MVNSKADPQILNNKKKKKKKKKPQYTLQITK